jgi:hypothetical protein
LIASRFRVNNGNRMAGVDSMQRKLETWDDRGGASLPEILGGG